jgi:pilus assembly protein CpaC
MYRNILLRNLWRPAALAVLCAVMALALPARGQQPSPPSLSPLRPAPAGMAGMVAPQALPPAPVAPQVIPPGPAAALPSGQVAGLPPQPAIIHKVQSQGERLEMVVNSSRILTLDQKIPQAQVNNPEILEMNVLSPNQVQVAAKKAGVTQVNLWGENKQIYTVDVTVTPDARELATILKTNFPKTVLRVVPVGNSVMISGYVDQPDQIPSIIDIAKEYYPKVINRMSVSGVQTVLLHVKVMEVSRTKLRRLGFDFATMNGNNLFISQVSGLIGALSGGSLTTAGSPTVQFQIGNASSAFFGVLDALREDSLAKILSEPNLVAEHGRPAYFQVGGEFGYQLNGGITGPTVQFKQYGTRIDYVAMVLGNGRIHLDVRPSVSQIDQSFSVDGIPALKTRVLETAVEMKVGQTLAIGGLVQNVVEAQNSGLPWISEVPYLGVPFRHVSEQVNEVELLILVTPELVEGMDADQVPPCGPGMNSASPSDWELFFKGHLEVPVCGPHCGPGNACAANGAPGPAMPPPGEAGPQAQPAAAGAAAPNPYNRYTSSQPIYTAQRSGGQGPGEEPPFIGPIGYDVVN